jgi:hypothetical protein
MFQSMAKTLKLPMERFYVTLHKYGNISSASCAIAFDEAVRDGSIQKGHLVCLPVFGGGLTGSASSGGSFTRCQIAILAFYHFLPFEPKPLQNSGELV